MSIQNQQKTVTEWGVEYTWPDGFVEVCDRDSRRLAEITATSNNDDLDPETQAHAVVVRRTVTRTVVVSDWVPAPEPAAKREAA